MALGALVVRLGLDSAEFTTGMTKAQRQAENFSTQFKASFAGNFLAQFTKDAIGSFGRIASAAFESVARFKDFEEKMGDTASAISGLQKAADITGTSMDTIASASIRLTATLAKTDEEGKGAAQALSAIGLSLKDFKNLSPVEQIEAVSKSLAQFEDGAGKTAVAVKLFGKSGAELLPMLMELNTQGGAQVRLSQQQIEAADALGDKINELKSDFSRLAQVIVGESSPAFSSFIKNMEDLLSSSKELGKSTAVQDFAWGASRAIASLIDSIRLVSQAIKALLGSFSAVWADVKFAGQIASGNLGITQESRDQISRDFAERNKTVEESNKNYIELMEMFRTDQNSVLKGIDADRAKFQGAADFVGPPAPTSKPKKPKLVTDFAPDGKPKKKKEFQDDAAFKMIEGMKEQEAVMRRQLETNVELTKTQEKRAEFESMMAGLVGKTLTKEQQQIVAGADSIRMQFNINEAVEKLLSNKEKHVAMEEFLVEVLKKEADHMKEIAIHTADARAAAEDYLATLGRAQDREFQSVGLGDAERARLQGRSQMEDKYSQQRQQLESDRRRGMDPKQYQDELRIIDEFQKKALDKWDSHYARMQELHKNGFLGAREAMANYVTEANDNFSQVKGFVENMFSGLEDVIVKFAQTGKLSFTDLANSIIADMARIAARKMIAGIMESFMASSTGTAANPWGGARVPIRAQSTVSGVGYGSQNDFMPEARPAMAAGTNYVPYDGMKATLHKGEAIVPKAYNPAAGGGSEQPINVTVQMGNGGGTPGNITPMEFERLMRNSVRSGVQQARRRNAPIY